MGIDNRSYSPFLVVHHSFYYSKSLAFVSIGGGFQKTLCLYHHSLETQYLEVF